MSNLHVFFNDTDWVVAADVQDAIAVWEEAVGDTWQIMVMPTIGGNLGQTMNCASGTRKPTSTQMNSQRGQRL